MRILSRYILKEYLVPLGYCLTGFISIYVLFELFGSFSRIIASDAGALAIARYFCGYLGPYFHYLAPAALMLAALYTMWSFCRHSELVAMRANGISFAAIAAPMFAVALAMTGFVYWVNDVYVPKSAQWAVRFKNARFSLEKMGEQDDIIFRNADAGRTWTVDGFGDRDGYVLQGVKVAVDRPHGGARLKTVTAERAEYLDGVWYFTKPKVQHYDSTGSEVATPTPALDRLPFRPFEEFTEKPLDFILQNRPWQYNSVGDMFHFIKTRKDIAGEQRQQYIYDAYSRLMAPWACVLIVLIAIPAGVASGRQSVFKGIMSALGMFFAFYGLVIGGMVLANLGWLWPIPAAVLPYVIFAALGARMFWKQR